jgi:acyl dehydratase
VFFEDVSIGSSHWTEHESVSERGIVAFGREWDPQPFHVDPLAAKESPFGGLIASGLQTVLISYRLFDRLQLLGEQAIAGLGYEGITFASPVRPGDILRVRVAVATKRPTRNPARGVVTFLLSTQNQDSREVLRMSLSILAATRTPENNPNPSILRKVQQ